MEHLRGSVQEIQQIQCGAYLTLQYPDPMIALFMPPLHCDVDSFPRNENDAGAAAAAQVAMLSRDALPWRVRQPLDVKVSPSYIPSGYKYDILAKMANQRNREYDLQFELDPQQCSCHRKSSLTDPAFSVMLIRSKGLGLLRDSCVAPHPKLLVFKRRRYRLLVDKPRTELCIRHAPSTCILAAIRITRIRLATPNAGRCLASPFVCTRQYRGVHRESQSRDFCNTPFLFSFLFSRHRGSSIP
jgi:hypothetical protein